MKRLLILIPIFILNIISLLYLSNTIYLKRQLLYISLSYIIFLIFYKINFKYIKKFIKPCYYLSLFLLLLVLIIGKETNGSKAWLHIYKFSLQPSEITKLVLTILFAIQISSNKTKTTFLYIIPPIILTYLEPDTGAIIIYLIILLSALKYTKKNKKITIGIMCFLSMFIIFNLSIYKFNQPLLIKIYGNKLFYRIDRLISFKNKDNIQNINSLTSIGANKLLYIPENHNDFIFAAIISKYNIIVTLITYLSLLSILIYYILNYNKKRTISNIINFITLNILLFSIFYNILMNISLVPIIGIPIPFLSYGGSYLITLYTLIGISLNESKDYIHNHHNNYHKNNNLDS